MADPAIYGIAVVITIAGFTVLYQFRQASKDYLKNAQEATYEAIRKANSYSKDRAHFFKMYETIHAHYTQASEDADAYIRISEGLILLGIVVACFNFVWESLQPNAGLYFVVLVVAIAYFFLSGTWGLLKRVHRAKPPRFEFRDENGSIVLQVEGKSKGERTRRMSISRRQAEMMARDWVQMELGIEPRWEKATVNEVGDEFEVEGNCSHATEDGVAYYPFKVRVTRTGEVLKEKSKTGRASIPFRGL